MKKRGILAVIVPAVLVLSGCMKTADPAPPKLPDYATLAPTTTEPETVLWTNEDGTPMTEFVPLTTTVKEIEDTKPLETEPEDETEESRDMPATNSPDDTGEELPTLAPKPTSEDDPVVTEPVVTEPERTEPEETEPVVTEPETEAPTEPEPTEVVTEEAPVTEPQPATPGKTVAENGVVTYTPENFNGIIVCVDAGHQKAGISDVEPNGPGSEVMKAKLTSGTAGVATGVAEYQINLDVSQQLRVELLNAGYGVVMIRENNDCPLSNAERAVVANQSGASIFLRIHCNSVDDPSVYGVVTMAPTTDNPYVGYMANQCQLLSQIIVDTIAQRCGTRNGGVIGTDTMTGINWCQIPVSIIEMGFMSNPDEDLRLSDPEYQDLIVLAIVASVNRYFGI